VEILWPEDGLPTGRIFQNRGPSEDGVCHPTHQRSGKAKLLIHRRPQTRIAIMWAMDLDGDGGRVGERKARRFPAVRSRNASTGPVIMMIVRGGGMDTSCNQPSPPKLAYNIEAPDNHG